MEKKKKRPTFRLSKQYIVTITQEGKVLYNVHDYIVANIKDAYKKASEDPSCYKFTIHMRRIVNLTEWGTNGQKVEETFPSEKNKLIKTVFIGKLVTIEEIKNDNTIPADYKKWMIQNGYEELFISRTAKKRQPFKKKKPIVWDGTLDEK